MRIAEALQAEAVARNDAEVLVAALLRRDHTWVLAHDNEAFSAQEEQSIRSWLVRRRRGEPVAYITGTKEFFGRAFRVTPDTLIPRPSTERLVEIALRVIDDPTEWKQWEGTALDEGIAAAVWLRDAVRSIATIVDVGTGSGCIAITLAHMLPDMRIIATDISSKALSVATANARVQHLAHRIEFREGSLLEPINDIATPFFVISNPPYVPDSVALPREVSAFEPSGALFAGEHGLDAILPLIAQAHRHPQCIGYLFECRSEQERIVSAYPSTLSPHRNFDRKEE